MNIQDELRDYRERYHLSYKEMAEKAGVSKTEIWALINNNRKKPRHETILLIQERLGIRLEASISPSYLEAENARLRLKLNQVQSILESD